MLTHVVMWKLRSEALGMAKPELAVELRRRLMALVGVVPEIRTFSVGINALPGDTAADVVLVSSFDDFGALDRYVKHPQHQEVVAFVKQVITERRAVDFEG